MTSSARHLPATRSVRSPTGSARQHNYQFEYLTKTPYFWGSRSFKVIDVDISKKLVVSACYDKQHICAYLQPFSRWRRQ